MSFLPIVERELRVIGRRRATYWLRLSFAVAALAVWFIILALTPHSTGGYRTTRLLFTATGVLAFAFCLLSGVFLTADCLSEEKRQGTLGLLFLTPLRGYDIVLGKLVATSLSTFYAVLGVVPMLALPLLMGGVTVVEFWRVSFMLIVTFLFSLSAGVLVSALSREAQQAMTRTLAIIICFAGLLPLAWFAQKSIFISAPLDFLVWPSPVYTYLSAIEANFASHAFWRSALSLIGLSAASLGIAGILLPRYCEGGELPRGHRGAHTAAVISRKTTEGSLRRWAERARALNQNPFLWRASFPESSYRSGARLVLILGGVWFCFFLLSLFGTKAKEAFVVALFTAYALHQIVKYMVAQEATRTLFADQQSGALELLLVTPLPEAHILEGQAEAVQSRMAPFRRLLLTVNLCMCGAAIFFSRKLHMSGTDVIIFLELFLGGILVLYLDFKVLVNAGMLMALRARRHHHAIFGTLGRVMLPSWGAVFLLVFVFQTIAKTTLQAGTVFAIWFAFGIITDLIVSANTSAGLARGFRHLMNRTPKAGSGYSSTLAPRNRDRIACPVRTT